ncbi:MAG: glycosyltransferase family 25 protein [Snodgrassella sp.]|nr:glycosyltransferase family 25 protein [Snodgrassella sp.]
MISALVINLDHSSERLKFQRQQLAHLQIPMQRLTAVNSSDFLTDRYEQLANGWERKMSSAEVACFLSHKAAWQYVAASNKPWLIMEDDALLSRIVPAILHGIINQEDKIDYITLETRYRRKWLDKTSIDLVEGYRLRRLYQDRSGAAAYILFPSGAKKLLDKAQRCAPALADAFLCCSYELNSWQVYPAAAIQLDQCCNYDLDFVNPFVSTITPLNYSRPEANNCVDYWRFKLRRVAAQLRMGWRQLSVCRQAEYVMVPIQKNDYEYKSDSSYI